LAQHFEASRELLMQVCYFSGKVTALAFGDHPVAQLHIGGLRNNLKEW